MYDLSADLQKFYDVHVRLGGDRRKKLGECRDTNLDRIDNGLDELADETKQPHPHPIDFKNQGGYAMHTINQAADNDYDIDVALIFRKEDIPEDPLEARQRVCDALTKKSGNFSKDPEARTNAVTVWYDDGYHLDFAVYRTWADFFGTSYTEHASTEWKRREPMEVNDWFAKRVSDQSPKAGLFYTPKVAEGQMRRIVRFLKWFCRSRTSWCLPGGMVVSTVVAESYRPDGDRDDVALYKTMVALRDRLKASTEVRSPVDPSQKLTEREDVLKQVERLRDNLDSAVGKLSALFEDSCTRERARFAWDWVFNHEFWAKKEEKVEKASAGERALPFTVQIECGLAKRQGWLTYRKYPSAAFVLPKGISLKFSVVSTNTPQPYSIHWIVDNEGDEATDEKQQHWEKTDPICWTSTKYKGTQTMTCQLERDGRVLAKSRHVVKISGGRW